MWDTRQHAHGCGNIPPPQKNGAEVTSERLRFLTEETLTSRPRWDVGSIGNGTETATRLAVRLAGPRTQLVRS